MPKKTPTQLDREIAEFLAFADYEKARDEGERLDAEVDALTKIERAFPHLPNGLPVEAVRATLEYQAAKTALAKAFTWLQRFNTAFVKKFAKQMRAERREKSMGQLQEERRARQAARQAKLA